MTPDTDAVRRLANRFPAEVATEGRTDRIDELCAPDVVEHGPMGEIRGREALKGASRSIQSAFADLSVTIEDSVTESDTVAQRLTFRGVHEGEFMGVEPTGAAVEAPNMAFNVIGGGQITERWLLPDMFAIMGQLGVVESPGD